MENIIVVAYLVTCAPNFIACKDLSSLNQEWHNPAHCVAALPKLTQRYESLGYRNIMAKCHYLMKDGRRLPIG